MSTLVKIAVIVIINLFTISSGAQSGYSLTVQVKDADSNDGKMMIAVYNSESDFLDKTYMGTQSDITNNSCVVTFENIPEGIYAVSIFHDENDNDKLDSNFIGIPKEDYGCSNDAKGFMGPPKWKDAKFELKSDKTITITL
ncbi:DUF2141 domain-containing protein [Winogradskyella tangerina]|uniref:DUF2141 domain-containing protein n=1 Tax=Winogradskyella tangerina TaxID=2023240 RepID=UPI000DBE90D0|nr:DUF2141 domain-containing protein [Winogradskyella tangerina]